MKVGSTEVSIVESTPEKIIIRAAGKNSTYAWDELPFGIAVAISDLGLDANAPVPTSLAHLGASEPDTVDFGAFLDEWDLGGLAERLRARAA